MDLKEIQKRWKGNKRYTLKLIAAMPEEQFDFKPVDGVKSFKSQASHITTWLRTHSKNVTGQEMPKPNTKTKEAII